MRPIKFRGKSKTMNRWLYGSLINNAFFASVDGSANCQILDTDYIDYDCFEDIGEQLSLLEVDPKSVGQYTGLKNKNGREIYEGDILKFGYVVTYVDGSKGEDLGMNIGFYSQRDDFESWGELEVGQTYEVIGNIYENLELLEGETNDQKASKEGTS